MRALGALLAVMMAGCVSVVPAAPDADTHSLRFVAQSGIARVDGRFGSWRIVEARIDRADIASGFALIEVDVGSIETGWDGRDDHLRHPDFFDVARWPTASVRVHDAAPLGVAGRYQALFDVQIRDVTRTLTGTFEVVRDAPLVVAGELVIDRVQFGVGEPPSRWIPTDVDRSVTVRFRAKLEQLE